MSQEEQIQQQRQQVLQEYYKKYHNKQFYNNQHHNKQYHNNQTEITGGKKSSKTTTKPTTKRIPKNIKPISELLSKQYFGNEYSLKFLPSVSVKYNQKQQFLDNYSKSRQLQQYFNRSIQDQKNLINIPYQRFSKKVEKNENTVILSAIQQKLLDFINNKISKQQLLEGLILKEGIYYNKDNVPVLNEDFLKQHNQPEEIDDDQDEQFMQYKLKKQNLQVLQSIQFFFNELFQQIQELLFSFSTNAQADTQADSEADSEALTDDQINQIKENILRRIQQIHYNKFYQNNSKNELIYITNLIFISLYQMQKLDPMIIFDKDTFQKIKQEIKQNVNNIYYLLFKQQFNIDTEIEKFVKYLEDVEFTETQEILQDDFLEKQQRDEDNQQQNDEDLLNTT